jgi:hypothetical protein
MGPSANLLVKADGRDKRKNKIDFSKSKKTFLKDFQKLLKQA